MSFAKISLLLLLIFFCLTSCLITDSVRTTQIEIMKPGIFIIPEDLNTVAVINRNLFRADTCVFKSFNGIKNETDTTIKNGEFMDTGVKALSAFLEKEGYFKKVINYHDSLNYQWTDSLALNYPMKILDKTQSDICIFLDFIRFSENSIYKNLRFLQTTAHVVWTIAFKSDTTSYIYNQADTLIYEGLDFPEYFAGGRVKTKLILNNASEYLARYFGAKMVPSWVPAERLYYKSHNPNMLAAEKLALNNDWLKAAEIWNKETKNKNHQIAAKACYNMALACEMEGKYDFAIDWLVKSYSGQIMNSEEHKQNCQRYINVLALRKKEIEQLSKQVRN